MDGQRSALSTVTLGYTLDEWLKTVEVEDSTCGGYVGYVERATNLGGRAVVSGHGWCVGAWAGRRRRFVSR